MSVACAFAWSTAITPEREAITEPAVGRTVASKTVQFRSPPELAEQLAARATQERGVGSVAQRDLERYYTQLHAELRQLRLRPNEALFLCDLLSGTSIDAMWAESGPQALASDIEDAQLDELGAQWGVDEQALAERVRSYSRGQVLALVDAVERWWNRPVDADVDQDTALVQLGLVRKADLTMSRSGHNG